MLEGFFLFIFLKGSKVEPELRFSHYGFLRFEATDTLFGRRISDTLHMLMPVIKSFFHMYPSPLAALLSLSENNGAIKVTKARLNS